MIFKKSLLVSILSLFFSLQIIAANNKVYIGEHSKISEIALEKLALHLSFSQHKLSDFQANRNNDNQIILVDLQSNKTWLKKQDIKPAELKSKGYQIINNNKRTYTIGGDEKGLMYGILDLRDHTKMYGEASPLIEKIENP